MWSERFQWWVLNNKRQNSCQKSWDTLYRVVFKRSPFPHTCTMLTPPFAPGESINIAWGVAWGKDGMLHTMSHIVFWSWNKLPKQIDTLCMLRRTIFSCSDIHVWKYTYFDLVKAVTVSLLLPVLPFPCSPSCWLAFIRSWKRAKYLLETLVVLLGSILLFLAIELRQCSTHFVFFVCLFVCLFVLCVCFVMFNFLTLFLTCFFSR